MFETACSCHWMAEQKPHGSYCPTSTGIIAQSAINFKCIQVHFAIQIQFKISNAVKYYN